MRKILTMFLLLVSVGLLFGGAVSAAAYVDVAVLDQDENPIDNATEGDEVLVGAFVDANDTGLEMPYVEITVDPTNGLEFDVDAAGMTTDGINWIYNDDPVNGGFFFWYAPDNVWVWDIHMVTGDMDPYDRTELLVPAMVTATGNITVNGNLWEHLLDQIDRWVANDSYTFLALPADPSVNADTVPMQDTGAPIGLAVLGLLGIVGGLVYNRLR